MDDLIDQANLIRQNYETVLAVANQITSPENIARQERLKHLQRLISNELKFSREDTLGNVDARPITRYILEKVNLWNEIERDRKDFAQQLQDAKDRLASTSQGIRSPVALASSTPALRHEHGQTGSILTPTRSSPSRECNPGPLSSADQAPRSRSSLVSRDDNRANNEFNPEVDTNSHHQPPLSMGSEDPTSSTAQVLGSRPRRTVSTVSPVEDRPAKRSRRSQGSTETVERTSMTSNARAPTGDNNLATIDSGTQPTQASSAPHMKRRRTRKRKAKAYQWKAPASYDDLDPRVLALNPGDIVAVRWGKPNIFQPAMVLPWGLFKEFNWTTTLEKVRLNLQIPKCYDGAQRTDFAPRPWASGFEDNGPLAHKRFLPVLFFRKLEDFPVMCKSSWVQLNKLKVFDEKCPYTINKGSVKEYLACHTEDVKKRAARLAAENLSEEDEEFDSDLPGENEHDQSQNAETITGTSSSQVDGTGNHRPGHQLGQHGAVTDRHEGQGLGSEGGRANTVGNITGESAHPTAHSPTRPDKQPPLPYQGFSYRPDPWSLLKHNVRP
ncbi:hypothetical protein ACHAPJ_007414 [Fusarium lateritium]